MLATENFCTALSKDENKWKKDAGEGPLKNVLNPIPDS